jgi:RNA polymerase sigma-54 factor
MRQSLEILQAPMQELQALIARELELNPTLEISDPDHEQVEIEPDSSQEFGDVSEREFEEEYEMLARLDDDSRASFHHNEVIQRPGADAESKRQFLLESMTRSLSLQEHLHQQLNLSTLNSTERRIGEMIIGSLDDDGFLALSLEDLSESIGEDLEVVVDVLD